MARSKELVRKRQDGDTIREEVGLKVTDDSWLPAPEILAGYEKNSPGATDRYLSIVEKLVDAHIGERKREDDAAGRDQDIQQSAQRYGFVLGMTIIIVGGILQYTGTDLGFWVIVTGVGGIVGTFVAGRLTQPTEYVVVSQEEYDRLQADDSEE